jgi:hypothetical protein
MMMTAARESKKRCMGEEAWSICVQSIDSKKERKKEKSPVLSNAKQQM